jgi:hypothetical protein
VYYFFVWVFGCFLKLANFFIRNTFLRKKAYDNSKKSKADIFKNGNLFFFYLFNPINGNDIKNNNFAYTYILLLFYSY